MEAVDGEAVIDAPGAVESPTELNAEELLAAAALVEASRVAEIDEVAADAATEKNKLDEDRKFQLAKLEAAWNLEVLTLDLAMAVAIDTAEITQLARLRASREASKATLDAARRAEVARVEAAWVAEIAKCDSATRAKIARLERAKREEVAHLEARRRSESTAASSLELQLDERRKSEAYMNHEIKNRLVAMGELCESEASLDQIMALVEETFETTVRKDALRCLAVGTYSPSPEQIDLSKFIEQRALRFRPASRLVDVTPTTGDADALLLDPLLLGIVLDNLLSNAAKYGGASGATVEVSIESLPEICAESTGELLEDDVRSVRVAVTNAAGAEHAGLLELGEDELNKIAASRGVRVRPDQLAGISAGEGYPMALASAEALGGTLRLSLLPSEVVATLTLPRTPVIARPEQLDDKVLKRISELKWAIVDDSKINTRMLERAACETFDAAGPRSAVCTAGSTLESIQNFPDAVVAADADIVFVDQNFGAICRNPAGTALFGTDIVRSIRALDETSKATPRLILVVSSNDSPENCDVYKDAGADGSLSKYMFTKERLRRLVHGLAGAGKVARLNAQ